jgi:condensin complex subunit 2
LPSFQSLPNYHIVPFLKGYDFFTDNDDDLAFPDLDLDQDNAMDNALSETPVENEEEGFQFDDYDVDFSGDVDVDPFQFDNNEQGFDNDNPQDFDQETEEQKGLPEHDFLSAMIHNNLGEYDMFSYFDDTLIKDWAGPEHWKLRRPALERFSNTIAKTGKKKTNDMGHVLKYVPGGKKETADKAISTKKKTKVADFCLPFDQEQQDPSPVFEPAIRKPALSKDVMSKLSDNLLPDDIHFSSKLLLEYSLKSTFLVSFSIKITSRCLQFDIV